MKGLENAIRNLNSLDTRMVPQASAWAINRVAYSDMVYYVYNICCVTCVMEVYIWQCLG